MHIAFLTSEYPHDKITHAAGIATSIKNLVVALVQKGIEVTVFVYSQKTNEVFFDDGVKIHLIQHKKYPILGWFFYRKHLQYYCNAMIKKNNINLIEAPDWTGITAFMNFKIPLVIRFHGSDTYFCHLEGRKQKIKNFFFEKKAVSKATAFVAPTQFAGDLSTKLFTIKNTKIETIHYGLALNKFQNPNPNDFQKGLILYIGTIIRKKGVFELPEIFNKVRQKHPKSHLVLIGGDAFDVATNAQSTWEMLKKEFSSDDLKNVTFVGKIPYDAVQNYLKKAHVCVFPSFAETLGMVTIEAMAMQKAVVNTNIGWANELIIDGESGFLVHPTDHEKFAACINNILENENLSKKIGANARKRVEEKFDILKIAEQNIDFYKSLIQKL